MTVLNTNKATQVGLLISYYITLSFWSAQTLALSLISRNIAGQTKRSVVVATNFVCWAVGNAIGKFQLYVYISTLLMLGRSSGLLEMERTALLHCVYRPPRLLQPACPSYAVSPLALASRKQQERRPCASRYSGSK